MNSDVRKNGVPTPARSTIRHIRLYEYRLPLRKRFHLSIKSMRVRKGYFIELEDEEGHRGLGEISPIPGFHPESEFKIREELFHTFEMLLRGEISLMERFSDLFPLHWKWRARLSPLIRFGLDQAFLHLLCRQQQIPLAQLWNGMPHRSIPINALLSELDERAVSRCLAFREEGYQAIKIKVGKRALTKEIEILGKIRDVLGPAVSLRLDANRRWNLATAVQFARAVYPFHIEYIEEPLREVGEVPRFYEATGMPVALDESLSEFKDPQEALMTGVQAVVFKPECYGEMGNTRRYIFQMEQRGIQTILSCSFYTGYTVATLAQLASAWIRQLTPQGLGTFQFFERDLLHRPLKVVGGALHLPEIQAQQYQLNREMLTLIRSG